MVAFDATEALTPCREGRGYGAILFDRHHLHRQTTWGYEGAMNIVTTLVNAVLEKLDHDTSQLGKTDYSFDLVR